MRHLFFKENFSANRTLVPIRCRVVKDLNDFDGSFTASIKRCLSHFYTDHFMFILDVGKCVELPFVTRRASKTDRIL